MADDSPDSAGCASLFGWAGAITFALGSALLMLMLAAGNVGPFGIGAFYAGLVMTGGVLLTNAYAAVLVVDSAPGNARWRRFLAAGSVVASLALLAVFLSQVTGVLHAPVDPLLTSAGVISFAALAALLPARKGRRGPGLLFAAAWLVLLVVVALHALSLSA